MQPISTIASTIAESTQPRKSKSTLNLQDLINKPEGASNSKPKTEVEPILESRSLTMAEVKTAWNQFAELRKNQVAEYSMLQREFSLKENKISLQLSNPVEEQLLLAVKTELIVFLRNKLNTDVNVDSILSLAPSKKIIYTNKEKFDHLSEKYPLLIELKNRLGLDTDY